MSAVAEYSTRKKIEPKFFFLISKIQKFAPIMVLSDTDDSHILIYTIILLPIERKSNPQPMSLFYIFGTNKLEPKTRH